MNLFSATLRRPARSAIRAATVAAIAATVLAFPSRAQAVTISMQALTSFGSNGWLQPSAFPGVTGTNNTYRSMALNPSTGSLLVADGSTVIPINSSSGLIGTGLPTGTGIITGGARSLNTVAVTTDGVIYGGNLTTQSTTTPFKLYRWASQAASAPTAHYSGNAGLAGSRVGDDLTASGTDGSGLLAAGFGSTPAVTGNNSFTTVTTGSAGGTATAVAYTGGAAGDFRLGIAFGDADTLLGTQGATNLRRVTFTGASGTLDGTTTLNVATERGLLYFTAYGTPLLATQEWGSGATTNTVRLYDATNLLSTGAISYLTQANLTTGTVTNANATGGMAFGTVNGTPTIYAMSTNNGIQAFQIVPEPSTVAVVGVCTVGLAAMMLRGRRRGQDA